jgi:hypothetical protein
MAMADKDFYNLDYIIEINEKRLEQYTSAYQKVLERLTNIILVYSGVAIFLIPIIQDISEREAKNWMIVAFICFCLLFAISLFFTIRLIIPIEVAYLEIPKRYYETYRIQYEQTHHNRTIIPNLLKASYIDELENALSTNDRVFRRKSSFYYNALMFGLLSVIPYLICLGYDISKKDDKIEKVNIVNPEINGILHKIDSMSKSTSKNSNTTSSSSKTGTTTQLPGVNSSQVIASQPKLIKENSQNSSTNKK